MKKQLFSEFNPVSSKQWKQQIQFELQGKEYTDTLVWNSPEGIKVKPFYHSDEEINPIELPEKKAPFSICQNIFVYDVEKSINRALESLNRGAESLRFTIEDETIEIEKLLQAIQTDYLTIYFNLGFLSTEFIEKIAISITNPTVSLYYNFDPIGKLAREGNWYSNKNQDNFELINKSIPFFRTSSFLSIDANLYQNAGATIIQELAYSMSHANEYFNQFKNLSAPLVFQVSVGTNYFFEIAKLRAYRCLYNLIAIEYGNKQPCHILVTPTKRTKTIYDYNVNMLRTTTECMSAILGGADSIANLPYDSLYHKDNDFGDRMARNQLLILKHESYFDKVLNAADGSYYIENLTNQIAEKALHLFKDIEANGGFLKQLKEGVIKRKIEESAANEQDLFDSNSIILLGTNKYPNKLDRMKDDLELYPFTKVKSRKTLISPIIEKRIAEKAEQERLKNE